MSRFLWPGLVLAMAALPACQHRTYEVEMVAKGDVLARSLTVSADHGLVSADPNVPLPWVCPQEVSRLSKLYQVHKPDEHGSRHRFLGAFTDHTPADVGQGGLYTRVATSMGTAKIYMERMEGDDDLHGQLQQRLKAADTLVDIAIGWMESVVGQEKGFPKLKVFLDTEFRNDVRNLALYLWLESADLQRCLVPRLNPRGRTGEDISSRLFLYLIQRQYVEPQDAATAVHGHVQPQRRQELVERVLALKAGVKDRRLIEKLKKLVAHTDRLSESLGLYLTGAERYRRYLPGACSAPSASDDPNADVPGPNPFVIVSEFAYRFVLPALWGYLFSLDDLHSSLACPTPPVWTNGSWDANARVIRWSLPIHVATTPPRIPMICYAVWAEPNEEFQKARFGRVVLRGCRLLKYCCWHRGQEPSQARRWDAFLSGLEPGPGIEQKLDAFKLVKPAVPPEKADLEGPPENCCNVAKRLIIQGLKASAPATQPASMKTPK